MSQQEAYNLTEACDSVFDVKTLRVGNGYQAYYDSSSLEYLVYERDKASNVVFACQPPYDAWVYEKPMTVESRYADVTINTSLWNDMLAADVSPLLIVSLSDIYAWTIDFFALQKGDRFRVLYQERLCDGEVIAVDTVSYAVFSHGGQELPMIMFDQKDGGNIWWNEKGESMRKAFLKAPLQFSRVSSGFSYARRHPVTRKVQPHTGVDYAAPKGTPVMTIGDGVVTSVKYEGAGGNTVRIRHNSVYTTAYLHLSKYAKGLKAGQRVRQGEVIGYVGSTGRSTGPHLDFRVWKNGTPINPLKMDSPPAEPIKDENRPAFEAASLECRAKVDTIQAQRVMLELMNVL
jgi:murein DD-endopeptidase MepM/ murein hydrolase activator NlpD